MDLGLPTFNWQISWKELSFFGMLMYPDDFHSVYWYYSPSVRSLCHFVLGLLWFGFLGFGVGLGLVEGRCHY